MIRHLTIALALIAAMPAFAAEKATPTASELLARSQPAEWRTSNPENLLYMQLPQGRVVIELAPDFTPLHAANIRTMARQHYYDGLAIVRVQDNFVTEWGDPAGDNNDPASKPRSLGKAHATLPPEYTRPIDPRLEWTPLPGGDAAEPLAEDVLGEHGGGGGAVPGRVGGLAGGLLHELGAHVLERVGQLDVLGHGHPVLGDVRRPPALVEDGVAAPRPEGAADGPGQLAGPGQELLPGVVGVLELLGSHRFDPP